MPEDNEAAETDWYRLARELSQAGGKRHLKLKNWLRRLRERRSKGATPRHSWLKNAERDQIIDNCRGRGMDRRQVCEELDRRTIQTLPSMQRQGIQNWTAGWDRPDHRGRIQQLFSKRARKQKAVKP